jgi:hypothetical protein
MIKQWQNRTPTSEEWIMSRRSLLLVLCLVVPLWAAGGLCVNATTPPHTEQAPPQPSWGKEDDVVITGSTMFIAAAWYCHSTVSGTPYTSNREGLDLVFNSMFYLIGNTGSVACMGDFGQYSLSGLQTGFYLEDYDQNYMEFVEENLNGTNPNLPGNHPYHCSYDMTQISKDDPLVLNNEPLYDLLMIGEEWKIEEGENYLHTRQEITSFIAAGGKVIIAGSTKVDPITGTRLSFLPKDQVWMFASVLGTFPLPPADPGHPIAAGIDEEEWGVQSEVYSVIRDYDEDYYYKVFSNSSFLDGNSTVLVVGGDEWSGVQPTSWGALKAGLAD